MGLLYPDHPDDSRPGLFEKSERPSNRRNPRSSDRRPTKRRDERSSRVYDEPITTSTTSSELKSLNDLMVRPTTTRTETGQLRKERDDFRDARRQERRERRERRERVARERTPSPEPKQSSPRKRERRQSEATPPRTRRAERSPSPIKRSQTDDEDTRKVRGPRKSERPRYERTSTYESDRRRESASPRKRRPSYADSRRYSSHDDRALKHAEPEAPRRRDSRARHHNRGESEIDAVPAPPPFTKVRIAETPPVTLGEAATTTRAPSVTKRTANDGDQQWKAPLETILSESHPQHQPETPASPTSPKAPARYNKATDRQPKKPTLEREESFVSSYLEGSNLELGPPPPRACRPAASDDTYSDSDSEYSSHRRSRRQRDSAWDEVEYYKYGQAPEDEPPPRRRCCMAWDTWSRRRKLIVIGGIIASVILLIILIAVAASVSKKYDYKPSDAQVNNTQAFQFGGATRNDPNNVNDSTAKPVDLYTFYQGDETNFPDSSKWISFKDMWNANHNTLQNSCKWLDQGENNSPEMIQQIFDAIQDRANASLVDHRFIFATILQESNGCPRVGETKSSGGVRNPGLMQSHNGHVYEPKHSRLSILQTIQDGTQGTAHGDGIVQNLNLYGNPYKAARGYNSGYIPNDGNLSTKSGATKCYVSDIANRLTGWVTAESGCHED